MLRSAPWTDGSGSFHVWLRVGWIAPRLDTQRVRDQFEVKPGSTRLGLCCVVKFCAKRGLEWWKKSSRNDFSRRPGSDSAGTWDSGHLPALGGEILAARIWSSPSAQKVGSRCEPGTPEPGSGPMGPNGKTRGPPFGRRRDFQSVTRVRTPRNCDVSPCFCWWFPMGLLERQTVWHSTSACGDIYFLCDGKQMNLALIVFREKVVLQWTDDKGCSHSDDVRIVTILRGKFLLIFWMNADDLESFCKQTQQTENGLFWSVSGWHSPNG